VGSDHQDSVSTDPSSTTMNVDLDGKKPSKSLSPCFLINSQKHISSLASSTGNLFINYVPCRNEILRFVISFPRSSRESKDISEKPFALAYVRLRLEKGTAVPDGEHKLAIFKVRKKNPCRLQFSSVNVI